MPIEIRKLHEVADMLPNWRLITQLTPELSEQEYRTLLAAMIPHNYFQAAVYEGDACVAVSGYWLGHKLYSGRYMEIDNFVVDEAHRDRGIGDALVKWLVDEAWREQCKHVMLDAYVENFRAHRFYYRHGFHARGFHYLLKL